MATKTKLEKDSCLKKGSLATVKRNKLIFCCTMLVLPFLQFLIFYVYVNARSFVLGFQEFSYDKGRYVFAGLKQFKQIFQDFQINETLRSSVPNSLTLFFWTFIFGSIGAVLFSYYIYKKNVLSGTFKVLLYLPHILGTVVVVVMYKYFVEDAIPIIFDLEDGLLSNPDTKRAVIMFYSIYMSFGPRILVYSSAMSGISDSLIESAQLDGVNTVQELLYIVLPSIWGTFITFMVASIVGIFTNQMALYTFYGGDAPPDLYTFGYYLYRNAKAGTSAEYPYLAAMGLLLTVIAVPLTMFTRWALKKYGPSKE